MRTPRRDTTRRCSVARRIRGADGAWIVKPASVELAIYDARSFAARFGIATPPADAPRYAGYRIAVADLDALSALLARNEVATIPTATGLTVQACGNVIEFIGTAGVSPAS